jgi:hypothetical protein
MAAYLGEMLKDAAGKISGWEQRSRQFFQHTRAEAF